MALALCARMANTECLFAGWWCNWHLDKGQCGSFGLLYISISKKGKWPYDSVSIVNWIFGCMLQRWFRKLSTFSGP
jgi:hypothetical protein